MLHDRVHCRTPNIRPNTAAARGPPVGRSGAASLTHRKSPHRARPTTIRITSIAQCAITPSTITARRFVRVGARGELFFPMHLLLLSDVHTLTEQAQWEGEAATICCCASSTRSIAGATCARANALEPLRSTRGFICRTAPRRSWAASLCRRLRPMSSFLRPPCENGRPYAKILSSLICLRFH